MADVSKIIIECLLTSQDYNYVLAMDKWPIADLKATLNENIGTMEMLFVLSIGCTLFSIAWYFFTKDGPRHRHIKVHASISLLVALTFL